MKSDSTINTTENGEKIIDTRFFLVFHLVSFFVNEIQNFLSDENEM